MDIPYIFEQEPGQAGKSQIWRLKKMLPGRAVRGIPAITDKVTRAGPLSSMWEADGILMLRAEWNAWVVNHLVNFPDPSWHDDIVDALALCYGGLVSYGGVSLEQIQGYQKGELDTLALGDDLLNYMKSSGVDMTQFEAGHEVVTPGEPQMPPRPVPGSLRENPPPGSVPEKPETAAEAIRRMRAGGRKGDGGMASGRSAWGITWPIAACVPQEAAGRTTRP